MSKVFFSQRLQHALYYTFVTKRPLMLTKYRIKMFICCLLLHNDVIEGLTEDRIELYYYYYY